MATGKNDPAVFWEDYEKKHGEKVLAYALGKYVAGWAEFAEPLWGLVIATAGGFRFHHFPHEGWFQVMTRTAVGGEAPQEASLFIPRSALTGAELRRESSWWKRLLVFSPPCLAVHYRDFWAHAPGTLLFECDRQAEALLPYLNKAAGEGE